MKTDQITTAARTSPRRPSQKTEAINDQETMMRGARTTTPRRDEPSQTKERSAVALSTVVEVDSVPATITAAAEVLAIGTHVISTTKAAGSTMATELAHPSEVAGVAIIKAGEEDRPVDAVATQGVAASRSKANPQTTKTETTTGGSNRTTAKTTVTNRPRASTRSMPGVAEEVPAAPWEAEVATRARRPVGAREATKTTIRSPSTNTGTSTTQAEAAAGGQAPTSRAPASTR